jgi:hypothetical protein
MKVYSQEQLPKFQVSGSELRVHWGAKQVPVSSIDGDQGLQWEQNEALCNVNETRSDMIEKIIASVYTTGAELAAINNGGEQYAAYQAFRAQVKVLVNEWFQKA